MADRRLSNIELLRIVAMLLVLATHANFYLFGPPSTEELLNTPILSLFRIYAQGISICCVDIFVIISGWFGIHAQKRSFLSFTFQCLYFPPE